MKLLKNTYDGICVICHKYLMPGEGFVARVQGPFPGPRNKIFKPLHKECVKEFTDVTKA